jgi:hypothetical protein
LIAVERGGRKLSVEGTGSPGVIGAYASLLNPENVEQTVVIDPPTTHDDDSAPQFLNVLRVCDIPEILGLLAPRKLTLTTGDRGFADKVKAIFDAHAAEDGLTIKLIPAPD